MMIRDEKYSYGAQFRQNVDDPDDWRAPLVDIDRSRSPYTGGHYRTIWLNVAGYLSSWRIRIPNRGSITLLRPDDSESKLVDDRLRGLVRVILDRGAPIEPLLDYVMELWPELEPVVQAIVQPPSSA